MKKAAELRYLTNLDRAIDFHTTNPYDPYGLGPATIVALLEVRNAFAEATNNPPRLWKNARINADLNNSPLLNSKAANALKSETSTSSESPSIVLPST